MSDLQTVLDALERHDPNAYDMATALGIAATETEDSGRWTHAIIGESLNKNYGKDVIGQYAAAVKKSAGSIRDYVRVYRAARNVAGANFLTDHETLSYTHWRTVSRIKDTDEARQFLEEMGSEAWSADKAEVERSKRYGKGVEWLKMCDIETELWRHVDDCIEISHEGLKALFRDRDKPLPRKLRFVIYEANELEETPE